MLVLFMSDVNMPDHSFLQNFKNGEIDFDITCLRREALPLQVRPKPPKKVAKPISTMNPFGTQHVGEKRTYLQMQPNAPQMEEILDYEEIEEN